MSENERAAAGLSAAEREMQRAVREGDRARIAHAKARMRAAHEAAIAILARGLGSGSVDARPPDAERAAHP